MRPLRVRSPTTAASTRGGPQLVAAAAVPEPQIPVSEPPPGVGGDDLDAGWALVRTIVVLGLVLALASNT